MRIVRRGRDVFGQTAPENRWYHLRVADMQEMEDLPEDVPIDIPSEPPSEIYD